MAPNVWLLFEICFACLLISLMLSAIAPVALIEKTQALLKTLRDEQWYTDTEFALPKKALHAQWEDVKNAYKRLVLLRWITVLSLLATLATGGYVIYQVHFMQ